MRKVSHAPVEKLNAVSEAVEECSAWEYNQYGKLLLLSPSLILGEFVNYTLVWGFSRGLSINLRTRKTVQEFATQKLLI